MTSLREDLEALAEEFSQRAHFTTALRRVKKERLLEKCALDLRAVLARYAEKPPAKDEIEDALDYPDKTTCRVYHPDGYVCTRAPGHAGDHLAGTWNPGSICARWSDGVQR